MQGGVPAEGWGIGSDLEIGCLSMRQQRVGDE